ncbi:MAG: hypothetical protein N3A53_06215 [Verrucomicrobiae bacterium]|nr:hypothetical protein [Verrucomicrobiae bacterium]MCX7915880.1 hypothetical protein [Verrucomicrobiae bacterium]MDW8344954.1 hypothetical protein [Verrucomicrobiae bacterium]
MTITKTTVAEQISRYLRHELTLAQLVDWAENAMADGEFDEREAATISAVVARLGVADVRAFGLTWEDCESLLHQLGFVARVEVVSA